MRAADPCATPPLHVTPRMSRNSFGGPSQPGDSPAGPASAAAGSSPGDPLIIIGSMPQVSTRGCCVPWPRTPPSNRQECSCAVLTAAWQPCWFSRPDAAATTVCPASCMSARAPQNDLQASYYLDHSNSDASGDWSQGASGRSASAPVMVRSRPLPMPQIEEQPG